MMKKLFIWLVFFSIGMQAQNVSFADANFKEAFLGTNFSNFVLCYDQNGNNLLADQDGDGEISLSEASLVYRIEVRHISNYSSLGGINSFVNLESLYYINDGMSSHIHGKIGDINIDGLNNLKIFNLSGCDIESVSIKNCPNLLEIKSAYTDTYNASTYDVHGDTQAFTVDNCPQVKTIFWTNNNLAVSNISNCPSLTNLELRGNSLVTFDASPLTNLEHLDVSNNQQTFGGFSTGEANFDPSLTSLNINGLSKLEYLNVSNQLLSSLDLAQVPLLETLDCQNNKLTSLNLQPTSVLKHLNAGSNQLTNQEVDFSKLNFENLYLNLAYNLLSGEISLNSSVNNFSYLNLGHNTITSFVVNGSININNNIEPYLNLESNQLSNLMISGESYLGELFISDNPIAMIDLPLVYMKGLYADYTNINNINVGNTKILKIEGISSEKFKLSMVKRDFSIGGGMYISNNPNLKELDISVAGSPFEYISDNPNLESIFAKNGINDFAGYGNFSNNPKLKFICVDDSELSNVKNSLDYFGYNNISVNTYCSFTPGGNFNTISGTVKFDANNNGCDVSDNAFEFLKLQINDGTNSVETFAQKDGRYEFYTQAGNFNVVALAENPTLFTVSPANFSTNFADNNNNVFTQDICVTANGNQNDAEVVIAPLTNARPGFDATYKLVWRNKGNTTLSGKVVLNYDASKMTFQNSSLPYSVASSGTLEFDYTNLKPYENTASEITFTINTPTHTTNPVNSGDILTFNAQITPNSTDLTPDDNNFGFNHTVVNSFDPNDIVCLEGETIPSVAVGKYLHYVVNFENSGTAEAENIVVKMDINPAEFDINTLQLQNASADVMTRVTGNKVEFIFKKIKLQSGGHGNVLLKVRSLNTLQEGDNVTNSAEIYFDYNFPIDTNDYITEIQDENSVLKAKINYEANQFSNNNYPVDFDGSLSTGAITNYVWEFSGTPTISSTTVASPSVVYNVPGNYTAKLTVSDADNKTSSQTISFSIGGNSADISTGKASDGNLMSIDSDDDDWKGYDVNGTEMTPKVRQTFSGWSYADIGNGNNSRWISLNNFEGYYTYKSREFAIPENATDAKLNLRSLSFVRNWTYLVKINPDGSEDEIEITKTQWLSDGFKGWVNSRSPKVDNYSLPAGRYYIKVLVFSNNSTVRQSLDVNAIVSCSAGLIFANKKSNVPPTLGNEDLKSNEISVYPIPTKGEVNVVAKENLKSIELYDSAGRILQNQILSLPSKNVKFNINANQGVYYLKIKTENKVITRKVIKE
ncbi:DUF7619 domain-containing protein [Epilithonimonas xixisoli]|uniref:Putative secreted protein (Por secretion system target) n=1 Tax=Epilithonimonas xixisoli TaxID=1476462 RepID=A0A4R8IGE1_9FLAO|nr:T9SS type A sorting domain-containing protein [Epilithonimonas xixisoli]TDX84850.1 putative secreted protein (Por secretion system target) [Epilithonimonas xixisoli]